MVSELFEGRLNRLIKKTYLAGGERVDVVLSVVPAVDLDDNRELVAVFLHQGRHRVGRLRPHQLRGRHLGGRWRARVQLK